MDKVFSMDDMADLFGSPHPHPPPISLHDAEHHHSTAASSSSETMIMNCSSSEWAFRRFLQEYAASDQTTTPNQKEDDVVEIKSNKRLDGIQNPNIPVDSDEYLSFLKSFLEARELACAGVALTRAANGKAQESAITGCNNSSQAFNASKPGSHVNYEASGQDSSKLLDKEDGVPTSMSKKSGAQVKSTTSGSSGEQSDDDEAEGETETTQNMDPGDAKRVRRMLSNRESARRSRRKQAHLTELERQVGQLRVENSSLLKRLTDISQKYNEAAVDSRVLKADVEALRAKLTYRNIVDAMNVEDEGKNMTDVNFEEGNERDGSSTSFHVSCDQLKSQFGKSRKDAAKNLGVSISTFKRKCRDYGITRWPSKMNNIKNPSLFRTKVAKKCVENDDHQTFTPSGFDLKTSDFPIEPNLSSPPIQKTMELANTCQAADVVIKAKFKDETLKFEFCVLRGVEKLMEEVGKRLNLNIGEFKLKYVDDDDGDLVSLPCDEDLHFYVKKMKSIGKTTVQVSVLLISD